MLAATLLLALLPQDSLTTRVRAVIAEHKSAYEAWYERYLEAEGSEEVMKLIPHVDPYGERLLTLATEDLDSDPALEATLWVATMRCGPDLRRRSLGILADHFVGHSGLWGNHLVLEEMTRNNQGETPESERFLRALFEQHPDATIAAKAAYSLAKGRLASLERPDLDAATKTRLEEEAVLLLEACRAERFREVEYLRGVLLAGQIPNDLFELRNLLPGKVAPDIEGEDLEGVPFKLSDYRGKVVLLDFWGHW